MEIYACLTGNWVNICDDPQSTIGRDKQSPLVWYNECASLWAPHKRKEDNTFHQLDFVSIFYKGKTYRINPIFIQIVE
ncbi:hypothetical protein [Fusobacterium sp. PH5-44]|uniref:hypothetical protein n=1 Tax=unclassified Fusobacterium TaxID=2648384 RepID=UPI003D19DAC8